MGILDKLFIKHDIQNTLAKEITKPVDKSKQVETTFDREYYRPGMVHQMDLLYLPHDDDGSKYLLVVVDIGTGLMDARALKNRTGPTVVSKLKEIYKDKKVFKKLPLRIQVDQGGEFNNSAFKQYFHDQNIGVRFAATARHSQQSIVENMNKNIGAAILKLQLNNELQTGESDSDWVTYLDDIINLVNDNARKTKKTPEKQDDAADVKCKGDECDILEVGALVRVALDHPSDIEGFRLFGNFRVGDYRFSLKPHKIENVLMYPNQPIRYVVEGYKNNTFSKAELLPFTKSLTPMKLTNNKFLVEKIVKREKDKNKIMYYVKWQGYDDKDNTWEPRTKLMLDVPGMVRDFDKRNK